MARITTKKIIWLIIGVLFAGTVVYFISGVPSYLQFIKVAESAFGMPDQDAGKISKVIPKCILDTPAIAPTTCAASCPLITLPPPAGLGLGSACVGYIEIDTLSQYDTITIAAPVGFVYKGGGSFPVANMSYIYGGASAAIPWVIGIPSAAASRVQKLVDIYKYIIAGFKSK